jgi:hypothetical protein
MDEVLEPQKQVDNTESQKYAQIQNSFTLLLSKYQQMRREQIEGLRYAIGQIIDDDTKNKLREQGRQILEYPIPQQTLLYVAGKLKTDMRKHKAVPTEQGTEQQADWATQRNEWAMEVARGYKNMATAGMHSAIAKRGVLNIYWDMEDNPEGQPVIDWVDPLLVMFDPDPGEDRFVCYFPMLSCEEIIRKHKKYLGQETIDILRQKAREYEPVINKNPKPTSWSERISGDVKRLWQRFRGIPDNATSINEWMDSASGLYRVVEWHDRRTAVYKFAYSPVNQEYEAIPTEYQDDSAYHSQVLEGLDDQGLPKFPGGFIHEVSVDQIWVTGICPALFPDKLLYEIPHEIQGSGFQFKKVDCYDWHPDPTAVQSIMDSLEAPTKFFNHEKMSMMALVGRALNPGVDAEENSIDPLEIDSWKTSADGMLRFYKHNRAKPEERRVPTEAFKLVEIMSQSSKEMIDYLSGVGQSAKGYQESAGESGVLYKNRISQTEVMIAYFFGQMEEMGHECFLYIDQMCDIKMKGIARVVSLTGNPEGPQWLELNTRPENSLDNYHFNYIVDPRSIGESQRAEKFLTLAQLREMVAADPVLNLFVAGLMSDFVDIPEAKQLKNLIAQRIGMMMQTEQQNMQMQNLAGKLDTVAKVKELREGPQNGKKPAKKAA